MLGRCYRLVPILYIAMCEVSMDATVVCITIPRASLRAQSWQNMGESESSGNSGIPLGLRTMKKQLGK